jgi:hypothetical protein
VTIIAEQTAPFGGRVTDIGNESFLCVVTTAKEGLFKGLTTMVYDKTRRPCAKLFYAKSTGKKDRQRFHTLVAQLIDAGGEKGVRLEEALDTAIKTLRDRGILVDAINLA